MLRVLRRQSFHEVQRRWALGELQSQFFPSDDREVIAETRGLLESPRRVDQETGLARHRVTRGEYIRSLPADTEWSIARLDCGDPGIGRFRTIDVPGWRRLTGGTLLVADAARAIAETPGLDPRVEGIWESLESDRFESIGLTLIGRGGAGPFTVVEGTGRLVSVYGSRLRGTLPPGLGTHLEVALGLSETRWPPASGSGPDRGRSARPP